MSDRARRPLLASIAALGIAGALVLTGAPLASAINAGTRLGDRTVDCTVDWRAASVMDIDLTDDDATYPGLMTRPDGTPVDYSNGGYIEEVRPENGGAGILQVTHWYGSATGATVPVNWRVPVATDAAIAGARLTITVPSGRDWRISSGADIARWGGAYAAYTWTNPSVTSSHDASTFTFDLGDLAAGTGVVVQLSGTTDAALMREHQVATATLTGTFAEGDAPTCPLPTAEPTPTPTVFSTARM